MNELYALALANLIGCGVSAWACLCRLTVMSAETVRTGVRLQYVVIFTGALSSGFAPLLWHEWPGWSQTLLGVVTGLALVVEMRKWRYGPPDDVRRGPTWPQIERRHRPLMKEAHD